MLSILCTPPPPGVGSLQIVAIASLAPLDTLALPSGWTVAASNNTNGLFVGIVSHTAGVSEPASYTFNFTSDTSLARLSYRELSGITIVGTPQFSTNINTTNVSLPSLGTTASAGCIVSFAAGIGAAYIPSPVATAFDVNEVFGGDGLTLTSASQLVAINILTVGLTGIGSATMSAVCGAQVLLTGALIVLKAALNL